MRIAIIGRTRLLLDAARRIAAAGHEIPIIMTCRADPYSEIGPEAFRQLADELGAEFYNDLLIDSKDRRSRIKELGCDLGVSVNWLTLIGQPTLALFRYGVLNAHAGDLPRYRGNACPNWAILNGESHVGLCVHMMATELDAGPVLLRIKFPLEESTYIGDVMAWIAEQVPACLAEAVELVSTGQARPCEQDSTPGANLRCYPRRPEDGRIDWTWSAARIMRVIRATSRPYPGAFSTLEGRERVILWRARPLNCLEPFLAVPGQICFALKGDPVVACSDGMLCLTDLELDGAPDAVNSKKRLLRSLRNRLI